ncbi:MAG: hypothetical protein NTV39_04530 [Candidatus Saccharibacteria bacterium]|nr:hypothetical protein [Candidatus Saccharibacteria bacterium]
MPKVIVREKETPNEFDMTFTGYDEVELWFMVFTAVTDEINKILRDAKDDELSGSDPSLLKFVATPGGDIKYFVTHDAFELLSEEFSRPEEWASFGLVPTVQD